MCACGHPKSGRGSKGQGIVANLSVAPRMGDQGQQALAADKSPESADDFTEVSRSRRTAVQRTLMARIDSQYALMARDWRA